MLQNKLLYTFFTTTIYRINDFTSKLSSLYLPYERSIPESSKVTFKGLKNLERHKSFYAEKYFAKQSIADHEAATQNNSDWEASYIANTTMAVDRRIKEIMARKVIKSNGGKLSNEHIELFNSMIPSEEVAEILGDAGLFEDCFKALEVEING